MPQPSRSVWEPDEEIAEPPARIQVASARGDVVAPPIAPPLACEPELLAILERPRVAGETAEYGFREKERQLLVVLASVSVIDSWHLHRRLRRAQSDDRLTAAFMRLVADRRERLLEFIAEARRRQATAAFRRR